MSNTILNPTVIAKMAVRILDNELVMANRVFRGYEQEFSQTVNGYKKGGTITIRKPNQFTVRDGATASVQDVTEGTETFTVNKQKGVDFQFSSQELALNISEMAERVMRPAMIQLANQVDQDLLALYKDVHNWVGTPGTNVQSFAGFAKAPERLDLRAVPADQRAAVLSPSDHWALAGSQTALYMQDVARGAYRKGSIGAIGGIDTYMTQNIQTHTVGPMGGTPIVNGANQNVTYSSAKSTEYVPASQTLITDGWTASAAARVNQGDVFTLAGVYDVNPVTKATLPYLKQFVVTAAGSSDGSGNLTLSIAPAIIISGAFQNCSAAPADEAALTFLGTAATGYAQNLVFHKNAFGLVVVPLEKPPGAVDVARESYKGLSVRVVPYYDGTNDISKWRLDILYGVKTLDPRLATRLSGT
jgi:hypothetical protein